MQDGSSALKMGSSTSEMGAVLVCIRGPDPLLIKSKGQPFFNSEDGMTTFSGSGVTVPATTATAVCSTVPSAGKVRRFQ
jgi:hypothetical protein